MSIGLIVIHRLYGMMKLSVLFFFRRIFNIHKGFRIFNNMMIALITLWTISYLFAEIFECGLHPDVQWKGGKNNKVSTLYRVGSICSLAQRHKSVTRCHSQKMVH